MIINALTLPAIIDDRETFRRVFLEYAGTAMDAARFCPVPSPPRLYEAHGAWLMDMKRVQQHEPGLHDGLNHFKQCGHLAFWLRRMSPIIELMDVNFGDSERPMLPTETAFRSLLEGYTNEYLAFDFCYQICKYYETHKTDQEGNSISSERARTLLLSPDYYKTACHFMKYKNVSPHAMQLIYQSLFYYNGTEI